MQQLPMEKPRPNKTVAQTGTEPLTLTEAEAVQGDNAHFVVSREHYDAFLEGLDRPAKPRPALQKLFSEPSILDAPS